MSEYSVKDLEKVILAGRHKKIYNEMDSEYGDESSETYDRLADDMGRKHRTEYAIDRDIADREFISSFKNKYASILSDEEYSEYFEGVENLDKKDQEAIEHIKYLLSYLSDKKKEVKRYKGDKYIDYSEDVNDMLAKNISSLISIISDIEFYSDVLPSRKK